ncbi:hypothetical protein IMSHALPRED_000739 [Imshaugia aleurites]|uniref:Uncharacterized protein n=1 Tax=Imshaugia aleurites TaxID=172621 RepID=A0A8H3J027_9LECA|nr:hypothetical protein IMSHALPRED_000739 [Imshaugia aleurites]
MSASSQPNNRPPHPPRRDPELQPDMQTLRVTGDMSLALDMAEFDGVPYPNLDFHDQRVYLLAFRALINFSNLNRFGRPFLHPRSHEDRLAAYLSLHAKDLYVVLETNAPFFYSRSRARLTLRALKQVSDGVRPKFETTGYLVKRGQL